MGRVCCYAQQHDGLHHTGRIYHSCRRVLGELIAAFRLINSSQSVLVLIVLGLTKYLAVPATRFIYQMPLAMIHIAICHVLAVPR
jgi:hypothetical protein